jgi:hypothetical protein
MALVTAANVLYLASYAVHDILWLRLLTVAGALVLIPYYALQPAPLVASIDWSLVFIALNAYWIVRLILERRPVRLSADEERLREISFPSLTRREARKLFGLGAWDDLPAGASLVRHDVVQQRFSVIFRGVADVLYDSKMVAELGEGQFVGGIDVLSASADIDVIVRSGARVMCWPRESLQTFLQRRPDVALALQRGIGYELRRLLDKAYSKLEKAPPAALHGEAFSHGA